VLWGNTSTPQSLFTEIDFISLGAPIYIIRQASSSLNDRFLPRSYIKTKAVMICDDDISIDLSSLEFALQVLYQTTNT
jgi:alpha-1,4-N-acetylglucosaminyltransferase EXTL3